VRSFAALVAIAAALFGQAAPTKLTQEQQALLDEFTAPFPPFHFIGNIYYVGTKELSSFLFVTRAGNILLDAGMEQTVPLVRTNIEKLGFEFRDTKILINSHAHFDHAGGDRDVRDATGAQVMVMAEDAEEVRRGHPEFALGWKGCPVDRALKDGDTVSLGGVTLTAHLTPGHTKGCTTWTTRATENGTSYDVVFLGGFTINEGVKLLGTPDYPNMAEDFARTFRVLKALPCDVFAAQHPYFFAMEEKVARLRSGGANPFVDPAGYRAVVADAESAYLKQLAAERR
jgi:metallo-beta-lactamase class B